MGEGEAGISEDLFASLQGDWILWRTVRSRRPGTPSGYARGKAVFRPEARDRYTFEEVGTLHLPAGEVPMQRRYVYVLDAPTGSVLVFHADSRGPENLLHRLRLWSPAGAGPWRATHTHGCGDDTYTADYTFWWTPPGLGLFAIRYWVRGPRKDYVMTSVLGRAPARSRDPTCDPTVDCRWPILLEAPIALRYE